MAQKSLYPSESGEPPFCHSLHFVWCMAQRSLYVVTKVYYGSISCFATVLDKQSALAVPRFPAQSIPSCTMRFRQFTKYVRKTDHKVWCHLYSTEHDTQPIANLISKQVIPYRTRSSTCCPRGSTPSRFEHDKPHYLMESNCLHQFNLAQITVLILTTVKSHLTRTQAKLNITKDGKTCTTHMTAWLSRTNQV
jgi:hypothetical protein